MSATRPTNSETRAPCRTPARMSRPRSSVPSQCAEDGDRSAGPAPASRSPGARRREEGGERDRQHQRQPRSRVCAGSGPTSGAPGGRARIERRTPPAFSTRRIGTRRLTSTARADRGRHVGDDVGRSRRAGRCPSVVAVEGGIVEGRPRPGQAKMISVRTAPVNSVPMSPPTTVTTGSTALRRAWRSARAAGNPWRGRCARSPWTAPRASRCASRVIRARWSRLSVVARGGGARRRDGRDRGPPAGVLHPLDREPAEPDGEGSTSNCPSQNAGIPYPIRVPTRIVRSSADRARRRRRVPTRSRSPSRGRATRPSAAASAGGARG